MHISANPQSYIIDRQVNVQHRSNFRYNVIATGWMLAPLSITLIALASMAVAGTFLNTGAIAGVAIGWGTLGLGLSLHRFKLGHTTHDPLVKKAVSHAIFSAFSAFSSLAVLAVGIVGFVGGFGASTVGIASLSTLLGSCFLSEAVSICSGKICPNIFYTIDDKLELYGALFYEDERMKTTNAQIEALAKARVDFIRKLLENSGPSTDPILMMEDIKQTIKDFSTSLYMQNILPMTPENRCKIASRFFADISNDERKILRLFFANISEDLTASTPNSASEILISKWILKCQILTNDEIEQLLAYVSDASDLTLEPATNPNSQGLSTLNPNQTIAVNADGQLAPHAHASESLAQFAADIKKRISDCYYNNPLYSSYHLDFIPCWHRLYQGRQPYLDEVEFCRDSL